MTSSTVQTRNGGVTGIRRDGVDVFLGIPYATAARFGPPAPPPPWDEPLAATAFGPIAPQAGGAHFQSHDLPQSEDCLSLNVWAPATDSSRRPVLVWIHGGAFRQGSGASPLYEGAALAARGDVVVVTINYRLGALGFLGHPAAGPNAGPHANWGLLDQVEALRWVHDNAEAFGGDPGNVTIFGESAGAVSVALLCAIESARGLFHKAIVQSGAAITSSFADATAMAEELAELAGVDDVAALAGVPLRDLLRAQTELEARGAVRTFGPTVDGDVLAQRPLDALRAGSAAGVPMVVGTNVDEWKLWAPMDPHSRDLDDEHLRGRLAKRLPADRVDEVLEVFRVERSARGEPVEPNDLFFAVETERFFRVHTLHTVEAQADQAPTWVYLFGWGSPAMHGWLGACHGLEIAFVFGNQGKGDLAAFTGSGPDADALAERMMDAWIAFARSGDPSTPAEAWPRYDVATRPTMVFDRSTRVEPAPRDAERAVVEAALR